jgi:hypothetical protein
VNTAGADVEQTPSGPQSAPADERTQPRPTASSTAQPSDSRSGSPSRACSASSVAGPPRSVAAIARASVVGMTTSVTRRPVGRSTRMRRLLPLLLATALIAGCGDDEEAAAPPPANETNLTIEVGGDGVDPQTFEFDCVTDPCDQAKLDKLAAATKPPDETQACTQLYGGPEEVHVTGTLRGEPVDRTIDRADGCGIAAYEALFEALGRKPPAAG